MKVTNALWIVVLLGAGTITAQDRPPNILLIVADDLGYGDVGVYGQSVIQTPEIDKLASEGMRFTDHYAGSTVCAPSRSALFTGQHTGHTPVRGNIRVSPMSQYPLPDESVTTFEVLKKAGYATAAIGKWGLGATGNSGEPDRQGVDVFYGYLSQSHAHNYYPEFLFSNNDRVPLRNVLPEPKSDRGTGAAIKKIDYSDDFIRDAALRFIGDHADGPFFLAYTSTLPHANDESRPDGMEIPSYGIYADRNWPNPQKGHAAMITRLDTDVGMLLASLADHGIADNTLVIFTSDNGPHREGGADPDFFDSNGPLRGIKRDLYEGGIRVPMIARWPRRIEAGSVSHLVSAFWDYLPTFAELAGVPAPDGLDGISFLPTLLGNDAAQQKHEFLYWEFHENPTTSQAARMGDWKGVRQAPDAPLELYNLSDDLSEQNNVAADHPDIVATIERYLDSAHTESEAWPLKRANQ